MKYLMTSFFFTTVLISHITAQTEDGRTHAFDWLIGTWDNERSRPGETGAEVWHVDPSGDLIGAGYTVRSGDTVFVEKLRIVQKENTYYYVASVRHNAAPVYFEIVESGQHTFVSENPEHDFPKKISYRREGTLLYAAISGNGKEIPFVFRLRE